MDAGVRLTQKVVDSLQLQGWQNASLEYTREEANAIDASLRAFQQIANDVMGGTAVFHREAAEPNADRTSTGRLGRSGLEILG